MPNTIFPLLQKKDLVSSLTVCTPGRPQKSLAAASGRRHWFI